MKYSITGAAGQISKLLVQQLLESGHKVRVIGRNAHHLQALKTMGAETAIGSVEDLNFLRMAFAGADAVYTMCPTVLNNSSGLTDYCEKIGRNYKEAIEANQITHVLNLSSVGAHLSEGAGHITGMNRVEQQLNTLQNVAIIHLRPVFFYTNLYSQMGMINNLGIMGSNFVIEANNFPLADPLDIAVVAGNELTQLNFTGHSVCYVSSDERGTDDIAKVIGRAIGKTELKWIKFSDEQAYDGMIQAGFSEKTAKEFTEGFNAINNGKITEDYWKHRPILGKVKLEEFAKTFAAAYSDNKRVFQQG